MSTPLMKPQTRVDWILIITAILFAAISMFSSNFGSATVIGPSVGLLAPILLLVYVYRQRKRQKENEQACDVANEDA